MCQGVTTTARHAAPDEPLLLLSKEPKRPYVSRTGFKPFLCHSLVA